MFLLDTNIIIAYLKGNHAVKDKIISNIEEIAVSALVIAELNYGAKSSGCKTQITIDIYI